MEGGIRGDVVAILEYVKVTELQHSETQIEVRVDCYLHLLRIEPNQQVIEDADVLALRFLRELLTLFWVGQKSNALPGCRKSSRSSSYSSA